MCLNRLVIKNRAEIVQQLMLVVVAGRFGFLYLEQLLRCGFGGDAGLIDQLRNVLKQSTGFGHPSVLREVGPLLGGSSFVRQPCRLLSYCRFYRNQVGVRHMHVKRLRLKICSHTFKSYPPVTRTRRGLTEKLTLDNRAFTASRLLLSCDRGT